MDGSQLHGKIKMRGALLQTDQLISLCQTIGQPPPPRSAFSKHTHIRTHTLNGSVQIIVWISFSAEGKRRPGSVSPCSPSCQLILFYVVLQLVPFRNDCADTEPLPVTVVAAPSSLYCFFFFFLKRVTIIIFISANAWRHLKTPLGM